MAYANDKTSALILGTVLLAIGIAGVIPASLGVAAYTTGLNQHTQNQPTPYTYYCVQAFLTGLAAMSAVAGMIMLIMQAAWYPGMAPA
jgi:hypothetical protein